MVLKIHCEMRFLHRSNTAVLLWHQPDHAQTLHLESSHRTNFWELIHTLCCSRKTNKKTMDITLIIPSTMTIQFYGMYVLSSPLAGRMHLQSDQWGEQLHTWIIINECVAATANNEEHQQSCLSIYYNSDFACLGWDLWTHNCQNEKYALKTLTKPIN